ncbi:RNA-guided pseudouridylation complex pseudouridine synthase subunit Cbf5 [Candidatus Pacearchaeota archaeon ex4484_26]|nr:MAG: RNA-guided pseudouridylation complex pseudouridine synthase subunit Cbf5 [Candidatus Pacearchaeota archaeon ex4484_26]RLF35113.1 MAG: RNA-guided pseudouridylation complex pseudouridine synthase subunit Cbf5 [Thermoplasmata archaeon]
MKTLLEKGIINLDKPIGPTSHQTTAYVMDILRVQKAGHSGTLDPKVSGVLPIALNRATRILELFLHFPKEYVGVMHLHEDTSLTKVRDTIRKKFLGKIKQIPPIKSAVKRQERVREIYEFKLLEKQGKDVLFRTKVQAGTYIRKLIYDLGNELKGAHMLELRRIAVGNFKEKNSHTLYELAKAWQEAKKGNLKAIKKIILPIEKAVSHLPKITLNKRELQKVKYGQFLTARGIKNNRGFLAGFSRKKFVCLLKPVIKHGKKLLKPEKVFV